MERNSHETTIKLLDPGAGKTKTACERDYARAYLTRSTAWSATSAATEVPSFPSSSSPDGPAPGTLVRDGFAGYNKTLLSNDRLDAG